MPELIPEVTRICPAKIIGNLSENSPEGVPPEMSAPDRHLYEFEAFKMDIVERVIVKQGIPVPLTPKAFDILGVLVQRSGHLFKKEELLTLVWSESFVEESNLTRNIYLLRKALGEGPDGHPFIETVPRKGYRFVANVRVVPIPNHYSLTSECRSQSPVQEAEPDDVETSVVPNDNVQISRGRRWWRYVSNYRLLIGLLIAAILSVGYFSQNRIKTVDNSVRLRSLAVLPFKSIDTHSSDEQLGLGMADAVISKLSRISQVTVLPTTAVFNYTGRARDPMSAGRELGVDAVLDGTIQHSGDQIRISVQLVNVHTGRTLWSKNFDQPKTGIFDLQDSVSEKVARTLAPELSEEQTRLLTKRLTDNPEAYDAYSMGLYFWNRRNQKNLPKAIAYFEEATKKDPNFARAYAYLADSYYFSALGNDWLPEPGEYWSKTQAAAAKALELDETTAEAHTINAAIKAVNKDFAGATREHQRALELDPNFATGHLRYSYHLFNRLRLTDAVNEMKRAQELDPLSPITNTALSFMLTISGKYDEAIKYAKRALELQPEIVVARENLAEAYASRKMFQEALALFDNPATEKTAMEQLYLAFAQAKAGRHREARLLLAEVERVLTRDRNLPRSENEVPYTFAIVYVTLGEHDKALEWMERVHWDRFMTAKLNFDPQLEALKSGARFESFLRRHKIVLGVAANDHEQFR